MDIALKKEFMASKQVCGSFMVFSAVALMSLGAFVRIPLPFTPVPITLQTFFVLLSASLLGKKLSVTAQAAYVFLGVSGLPVFTGAASGLAYLVSPTAGYLLGFIPASIFTAVAIKRLKQSYLAVALVFCISSAAILLSGSLWLKASLGISVTQAFVMGFVPFVLGDFLKSIAAASVYLSLRKRLEEIL
ncbi:MAG: biotin transporter BioY [Candidatus Omnitrophota bacterium]